MLPIKLDILSERFREPEQNEILSLSHNENKYFHNVRNQSNFRNAQEYSVALFKHSISGILTPCFYCGESDADIVPAFLHDGSGHNLWMFNDIRCSIVLCHQCKSNYGQGNVKYIKRFENIRPSNLNRILSFQPEILLPTLEPVHLHFEYSRSGYLMPKTVRAERTIDLFALNRIKLVERRRDEIVRNQSIIALATSKPLSNFDKNQIVENFDINHPVDIAFIFSNSFNNDRVYLMRLVLPIIHKKYEIYPEILDSKILFRKDTFNLLNNSQRKVFNRFSGLEFIEFYGVRNFLGIQRLDFNGKSSIIIVGENGVGKTTLLELLKRGLKDNYKKNAMSLSNNYHQQQDVGYKIKFINDPVFFHQHNRNRSRKSKEHCHLIDINDSRSSSKGAKYLTEFLNINDQDYAIVDWTLKHIMKLLEFSNGTTLEYKNKNILIKNRTGTRYLNELSSGYNSILSIFGLILNHFSKLYQRVNISEIYHLLSSTVVLIDEVELHLHPKFKKNIIATLKNSFPEVLFVFTTHDPMVLSSSEKGDVVVLLERDPLGDDVTIRKNLPDHSELTTEQILSSPIFGLMSLCYEHANDVISNYYQALNHDNKDEVRKLRKQLGKLGYFGKTYRDLIAYSAVDAYLSKYKNPNFDEITNLLVKVDKDD
ncbi:AAA family ATPase [Enterobacter sp. ENT02]|uniref:AAA family ATPase n=1 Tax=Enterobacter sp. ENT02 TaxID=2854767 RepID=UPI001C496ED8|nr:AAA family ATPase [Enterobacter sp. ENT02]MBV7557567.1 AAA family ATPase [Enterobacter sp. ENT02]